MNTYDAIHKELLLLKNPDRAKILMRFFKTGKGEYAEGDKFYGITVPVQRSIAQKFLHLPFETIHTLLQSPIHEERFIALLILVDRMNYSNDAKRIEIAEFYLNHTQNINNWDLVDVSADKIIGRYAEMTNDQILSKLATSSLLWERRIAMVATFHFIKQGKSDEAIHIATILLHDTHDLIHKAVGWMLREVGKRCGEEMLLNYLDIHVHHMRRTTLRYAIEKLSEEKRKYYLSFRG